MGVKNQLNILLIKKINKADTEKQGPSKPVCEQKGRQLKQGFNANLKNWETERFCLLSNADTWLRSDKTTMSL